MVTFETFIKGIIVMAQDPTMSNERKFEEISTLIREKLSIDKEVLMGSACWWLKKHFYQGGTEGDPEVLSYYDYVEEMIEDFKKSIPHEKVDMGEVSDGYHTFNELYEYRMLYNAALFNEFAKQGLYDIHKSRRHSDGDIPFGDPNWFIVMAELPTGQVSNHYEMKDWDKFQVPEREFSNRWDGHSPKDVTERLTKFLTIWKSTM